MSKNILFIANASFYNGLPLLLKQLAKDNGQELDVWNADGSVPPFVKDPEAQRQSKELYEKILGARRYDTAVVIELWHDAVTERAEYEEGVAKAAASIEGKADEVLLYEFMKFDGKDGRSVSEDYSSRLAAANEEIAAAYGMTAVHVGAACAKLLSETDIVLYEWDFRHLNYTGTVLAAMILYKKLFGELPADLSSMDVPDEVMAQLIRYAE